MDVEKPDVEKPDVERLAVEGSGVELDVEKLIETGLYDPLAPNANDRLALLQYLADEGATIDEMVESARNGNLTSLVTDQRFQRGALSAADMAERVGVPVDDVVEVQKLVQQLTTVTGVLRTGGFVLLVLVGFVVLFIIVNTIRLAVVARREEIEVMRLVGASTLFIQLPFMLEGAIAATLGAARGFIDRWIEENRDRVVPPGKRIADDPITQRRLAEATWTFDAARTRLRADAVELWEMAEESYVPTMEERGQYRWNLNRGCELVGNAVVDLFHAASGRSIYSNHPLQRGFQDVQGALGHAFLVPDPVAQSVGGALLGTSTPEMVL